MSLAILWKRLLQVNKLKLRAESFQPRKKSWRGNARVLVVLSEIDRGNLVFSESGEWDSAEKPKIKFFNVYRWRRIQNDNLELAHLRNGADSPVHLLDFKQMAKTEWISEKPHVCREDLYAAVLLIEEDAVRLKWTIDGPNKQQIVECVYT